MIATAPGRASLAPCSPPSMALRAGGAGRLWRPLTAAARDAGIDVGRDEETTRAGRTKKHSEFWPLA